MSYTPISVAINYTQMLRQLVEERESWVRKRDDAMRELSRLSELIRSTIKMLPPEQRSKCDGLFERIDNRPAGLTTAIRLCFTAGKDVEAKEWLAPVEIRDYLKSNGFNFERYRANPLASIHTSLKRMVPHEVECKTVDGRKIYRLKTVEQWSAALAETREWLAGRDYLAVGCGPWLPALRPREKRQNRTMREPRCREKA
jgi:hypothetical protein